MDNAIMFLRLDPKKHPPKPQIMIIIIPPIELDLYANPTIFYDI
jgi:hypothetical protein